MKIFETVREFFWPLLEKEEIQELDNIVIDDIITSNDEHLKHVLEQTIKRYDAEEERKKIIESKSSLFIGTTSIITTIVLGVTTIFINNQTKFNLSVSTMVFLLFILTLYMARTIWFSIQALSRNNYYTLSSKQFYETNSENYYKELIVKIQNTIQKNYKTINNKVDNMVMAQEYFKRAIIVVSIYSFVMLLFFLSGTGIWSRFTQLFSHFNMDALNNIVLYSIGFTSLFLSIVANFRIKCKK